jgi:hypothetical protein
MPLAGISKLAFIASCSFSSLFASTLPKPEDVARRKRAKGKRPKEKG